jgi:ubiquinone/menaquinone biosynthesis C-methylase UbiE
VPDVLMTSWGAFSSDVAKRYLKTFGHPSAESKKLLLDVIRETGPRTPRLLDLGCGNANLAEYLQENGLNFRYSGVDFSDVLLAAAQEAFAAGDYFKADVNTLEGVPGGHDIACYSHVVEMLSSPESSLNAAKQRAEKIVIRFFEPPADRFDEIELLQMDIGGPEKVPYLRRKLSQSYYEMILSNIGCRSVDVYRTAGKDQVHVLNF